MLILVYCYVIAMLVHCVLEKNLLMQFTMLSYSLFFVNTIQRYLFLFHFILFLDIKISGLTPAYPNQLNYLTSTEPPTSSTLALIASASSLLAPSLIALGALSTNSFASLSPRPVSSLTTLITLIF